MHSMLLEYLDDWLSMEKITEKHINESMDLALGIEDRLARILVVETPKWKCKANIISCMTSLGKREKLPLL